MLYLGIWKRIQFVYDISLQTAEPHLPHQPYSLKLTFKLAIWFLIFYETYIRIGSRYFMRHTSELVTHYYFKQLLIYEYFQKSSN